MNYARFLNVVSLARKPSPIRTIGDLLMRSPPSAISLATGSPSVDLFPFESATFKLKDGKTIAIDNLTMNKCLQYGATNGYERLLNVLDTLQKQYHNPPPISGGVERTICVTNGSQEGISKSFDMFVSRGDHVLTDKPTYAAAMAALLPMGAKVLGIDTDKDGMIPDALRNTLSAWKPSDADNPKSDIPKIMYTIPVGVNPTGYSLTLERKKEIYQIAREYNILIMEDDPYYYMQFRNELIPSFLSMDVDGRVMRFDSFSKVISAGLRLGFVTGPEALVTRLMFHNQVSILCVNGIVQEMVSSLFDEWGIEGFEKHVEKVRQFYKAKRDAMVSSAEKHLKGLAEWDEPQAGMFLWLKLNGIPDSRKLIEEKATAKGVFFVPGCFFMPNIDEPSSYVRASYSIASPEKVDEGIQRLAELIREEQSST